MLLASNVQLSQLAHLVSQVTTASGVRRVVLGVKLGKDLSTADCYDMPLQDVPEIRAATTALSQVGVVYTIVLYEDTVHRSETALFPYRISSGHNVVSSVLSATGKEELDAIENERKERHLVSSQDLARVCIYCMFILTCGWNSCGVSIDILEFSCVYFLTNVSF